MAFVPRPKMEPIGFNLTPMIDVTFQLLIFFVCANTWSHVESAEEMQLPAPIQSAKTGSDDERPRITLNIRPDGQVSVTGKLESNARLIELLRQEQRKHRDRLEVLVRADQQVPYAKTEAVLQSCARAGVHQVRFAVLRTLE